MKRSLIAIAVSSAVFTSFAQAADDSYLDAYGNIQLVYHNSDLVGGSSESEITDNGSTFGFKGETKLNEGLTGFFKYELEADADEKTNDISVNLDQAYVGAKGNFGKVQIGTFDSIYNNAIQDGLDQFEFAGIEGSATTKEGDTIAYFSPSFGGFEVQLSAQVKGDAESEVQSAQVEEGEALTAVVKYSVNALTLALGYDTLDNTPNADETIGLSASYQLDGAMTLLAKYEENTDVDTRMGVGASYEYGIGRLYGSFQQVDLDLSGANDYDEYALGATYNLGDNVYVYVEAGQQTADELDFTAVGAYYGF
ncbi:porin [Marinomonas sp. 15G1-11]|uniref:Porin n=1 Tax=Marinomonas phaeophyticola TaxID=3004091 RepID=A0ABT4JQD7_9GAMM|nr:porin [Marinomonas sp. 15G1-11]MCZ2720591.1 porin [Marinomonas sp. 15G1-11]